MGKKGSWFSAVRKALSPDPKGKKDGKCHKSKKRWFGSNKTLDLLPMSEETAVAAPGPPPVVNDAKLLEAENEQSKHAYSVALATAVAAEAAVAAAQAAAEVVRLTAASSYSGKSKEEIAAIKIQTVFRGYLARRALRALRGLVRLKTLIQGQSVKRQAATTLRCMQTLARVQSQVLARRIRMSEENQALQRQLQHKREKEIEKWKLGEQWDATAQSKEQIEANLLSKQEAAMRRERALAYAFSHQQTWKNSTKSVNPTYLDPNNPQWGWSWLERWMAARPWETRSTLEQIDRASVKSATSWAMSTGEMNRGYARREIHPDSKPTLTNHKTSRPPSRHSPATPPSRALSLTGRTKPPSPKGSGWGGDDESKSMFSVQSEHFRRHSIGGSSVRDDESLASTPSVPSYMAPTKSTKARSRMSSPLGMDKNGTPSGVAKKHLSFPASPAGSRRRHSGPPKLEGSNTKDFRTHLEEKVGNGERS